MNTPQPLEIARCLYPEFPDEVPSKAFASAMPLTLAIFSIIVTLGLNHQPQGPGDWRSVLLALLFLMVACAVLMIVDSARHAKKKRTALVDAHRLISLAHLDPNFQMTRSAEGIVLTGVPASSTPTLTQGFRELRVILTEEQLVAIAPLLKPLGQRFRKTVTKA